MDVLQREISLAYRLWQDVQAERLRTEGRLRSANLCKFCGGKATPKVDHECGLCSKERCAHCEGTGKDPVPIPEEALGALGLSLVSLQEAEARLAKTLTSMYRRHPLRAVTDEIDGLGEMLAAQLLGMVGDFGRFRNPAKLWAYLGLGVGADGKRQRRRRGEVARFRPEGQVWAYKVGEQFWHWKRNGEFGQMYRRRLEQEEAKGQAGAKKRAARYVVKMMLKRIWCAANGAEER